MIYNTRIKNNSGLGGTDKLKKRIKNGSHVANFGSYFYYCISSYFR